MFSAQMALGWCFPNAVMQYAVPDLEGLSIDQAALARRRDRLRAARAGRATRCCRRKGRSTCGANGPKAIPSALERARRPRRLRPAGPIMNATRLFRISLTASDEMVERALPAFAAMGER